MKKNNFIRPFLIAALLLPIVGCSEHLKKNEVVVIEKTKTYHREGYPPTNMAKTKVMTVAEAKADKNKPCPGCKPDVE